ncbi:APC family permease [Bdellovibrio svalbardensis]|uniref:APC family permease n=1 Tax=Bdellovibrio svalbardensis TaxID=2972972 RepID=A0ABT6DK15_9BACT|nr:APC family permease [Bdellovibrio svalbardensis]MDG0817207.1 APC family permease [Bdellovibrio svalbardensis]
MGVVRRIKRTLVGNPLTLEHQSHELIPKWKALAVLSSDALSSVAYATEEILIPLSLFAAGAVAWSLPIAFAVAALLVIITLSYRQTIDAYPNGGGAYTVAKENLGKKAGLVAGASLLIDYTLTVAVSVAAGVENFTSAFPGLAEHKVLIGAAVILFVMLMNLRGVKESASIFALPTYFFVLSIIALVVVGGFKLMMGYEIAKAPLVHEIYPEIPIFLLLRAFSSGCSALTGIEAISNGIPIFKQPAQKNAKITMVWMSGLLGFMFLGITFLAHVMGIVPHEGQTAVSLLASQVFGMNFMYYFVQISTALILFLAANTSYADFPRLASLLARDGYLPRQLGSIGDRLVFSNGIMGLSFAAIFLLILFGGVTHHLIPLYAVGVFLSFTLSQSGMIRHHLRLREKGWIRALIFNSIGALTTFVILLVIAITKFTSGAWIIVLLIPGLVWFFLQIKNHYLYVARRLGRLSGDHSLEVLPSFHTALVPVSNLHPGVLQALHYARSISQDVRACYVELGAEQTERLKEQWQKVVPEIPLVILPSPFRSVIEPVLDYIDQVKDEGSQKKLVTVIIPEFVTRKWYHQFLHNQTAFVLRAYLWLKPNTVVASVRYHI